MRLQQLVAYERSNKLATLELAMILEISPNATLPQCVMRARAKQSERSDVYDLFDKESARGLLRQLDAHDGPSALEALSNMQARADVTAGVMRERLHAPPPPHRRPPPCPRIPAAVHHLALVFQARAEELRRLLAKVRANPVHSHSSAFAHGANPHPNAISARSSARENSDLRQPTRATLHSPSGANPSQPTRLAPIPRVVVRGALAARRAPRDFVCVAQTGLGLASLKASDIRLY